MYLELQFRDVARLKRCYLELAFDKSFVDQNEMVDFENWRSFVCYRLDWLR